MPSDAEVVKVGWEAVARADWDTVLAYYTDDIILVMPGQNDVLEGKVAIRHAFDNIGAALPPGFEITAIREIGETGRLCPLSIGRVTSSRKVANFRCCFASPRERFSKNAGF